MSGGASGASNVLTHGQTFKRLRPGCIVGQSWARATSDRHGSHGIYVQTLSGLQQQQSIKSSKRAPEPIKVQLKELRAYGVFLNSG